MEGQYKFPSDGGVSKIVAIIICWIIIIMLVYLQVGWLMDSIKGNRPDIIKLLLLRGAKVTSDHIHEVVCDHKNE